MVNSSDKNGGDVEGGNERSKIWKKEKGVKKKKG